MCNQRSCRIILGVSAMLFVGSTFVQVTGTIPAPEQSAQAMESSPFDAASQRAAMISELRSIRQLLEASAASTARGRQGTERPEDRILQKMDEQHNELMRLLQNGKVKISSASGEANGGRNR